MNNTVASTQSTFILGLMMLRTHLEVSMGKESIGMSEQLQSLTTFWSSWSLPRRDTLLDYLSQERNPQKHTETNLGNTSWYPHGEETITWVVNVIIVNCSLTTSGLSQIDERKTNASSHPYPCMSPPHILDTKVYFRWGSRAVIERETRTRILHPNKEKTISLLFTVI